MEFKYTHDFSNNKQTQKNLKNNISKNTFQETNIALVFPLCPSTNLLSKSLLQNDIKLKQLCNT